MLDHYLHTAHRAAMRLEPYLQAIVLDPPRPLVVVRAPETAEAALDWFGTEQATLVSAVRRAAEAGLDAHAWQLAWALNSFLLRRGLWSENAAVQRLVLAAARRSGDALGEAHALGCLAFSYAEGRPRQRRQAGLPQRAADLREGGQPRLPGLHPQPARLAGASGSSSPPRCSSHSQRALELYRLAEHPAGQAIVLNDIGYSYAMLGEYEQALDYCQRSLAAVGEFGERSWEEATWDSLGYIYHQLGNYAEAITCYERSVDLCRELADRYNEAATLDHLGDVRLSAGDAAGRPAHLGGGGAHPGRDRPSRRRPDPREGAGARGQPAAGSCVTAARPQGPAGRY